MPRRPKTTPAVSQATVSPGRPLFEVNPEPELVSALKEAFGYFTPCDRAWWRVECSLKAISFEANPAEHDEFVRRYNGMAAADVIAFLVEQGLAKAEPTRSTKSKRAALNGFFIELVRRKAQEEGQAESVVMAEVDGMADQQFADVLLQEFAFKVHAKTVHRWRKARANAKRQARPTQGPDPAVEDHEHPGDRIDREEARQCGLSSRSRIDGITRRSKASLKEREREALYRQAEELGTRLLEAHQG